MILISDTVCCERHGPVTLLSIPDKVWRDLKLDGWVCLSCVAHALNPEIGVDDLSQEIWNQRRRFNLKRFNTYLGARMESTAVIVATPSPGVASSMTLAQIQLRTFRTSR